MNPDSSSLGSFVDALRQITSETDDEGDIINRVGPLAQRLALEKIWLKPFHYEADPTQGFTAHLLHEEPDHILALFVVAEYK